MRPLAKASQSCVRATDTLARVGEHSFSIILEDLTQRDQAARVQHLIEHAAGEVLRPEGRMGRWAVEIRLDVFEEPQDMPSGRAYNA